MESNKRTLTINPDLFKLNGGKRNKNQTKQKKFKPSIEEKEVKNINKTKKELLKKVKDYQKNKEIEQIKSEKDEKKENYPTNLFESNEFENTDFEREFNKSLNFLQNLEKRNKEKKKKKQTQKIPSIEVSMDLPNNLQDLEPSYGCLKNGNKPTYTQLNKTQKREHSGKRITISLENNDSDDNPKPKPMPKHSYEGNNVIQNTPETNDSNKNKTHFEELIDNKIDKIENLDLDLDLNLENSIISELPKDLKTTIDDTKNTMISINNDLINYEPNIETELNKEKVEDNMDTIDISKLPKINRVTRKKKYILGKKKGSKQVGILLKNRETQKNVKTEVSSLKSKSIQEIKDYLRKKNLIKLGSESPNDVLRELYEGAILSGDVENDNSENLLHNFLN
jgi:hypothetical protein